MVALNYDDKGGGVSAETFAPAINVGRLRRRIDRYLGLHPEVVPASLLIDALRREIATREEADLVSRQAAGDGSESPTAEENIDESALLAARLAELNYQRHGIWPRLQRFLFRDRR